MTITRNGVEIELTATEIEQAHKEWFHQYCLEDVDYYADAIYGNIQVPYCLTDEETEVLFNKAAEKYGELTMDYMTLDQTADWRYETAQECIEDAIRELGFRKNPFYEIEEEGRVESISQMLSHFPSRPEDAVRGIWQDGEKFLCRTEQIATELGDFYSYFCPADFVVGPDGNGNWYVKAAE